MPTVENLTPQVLWTTIYGLLALCLLFMVAYKVYDAVHTILERRRQKRESEKPDFAEAVSRKVIEKLEPRFNEIEKNLARDKARLDNHESFITDIRTSQQDTREGLAAICRYLLAIAQFGNISTDSKEMREATAEMNAYLVSKLGGRSK